MNEINLPYELDKFALLKNNTCKEKLSKGNKRYFQN